MLLGVGRIYLVGERVWERKSGFILWHFVLRRWPRRRPPCTVEHCVLHSISESESHDPNVAVDKTGVIRTNFDLTFSMYLSVKFFSKQICVAPVMPYITLHVRGFIWANMAEDWWPSLCRSKWRKWTRNVNTNFRSGFQNSKWQPWTK